MNRLATKIKTLRLTKGFSQEELAKRLGKQGGVISHLERGKICRASAIPQLAMILGVEAKELAELWMADSLERTIKKEVKDDR